MAENFSKGFCAAIVLTITIVALAGGCNHPRSTPESATPTSKATTATSNEVSQVSQALVGKQITIRGKLLLGKIGWYILLDDRQEVYFFPGRSSSWGAYGDMHGKLVTATGILRFFQCPKNLLFDNQGRAINKEGRLIDRCSDYFYFETETGQPRLLPEEGAAK